MPSHRTTVRPLGILLVVLAFVSAACGGDDGVDTVRVQRTAEPATPEPTVTHPLTGEEATGEPAWLNRPALAVKVENSERARPQSGLQETDVVYEELAEGGVTRFIAIFHSQDADSIGPVRSARLVDPDVVAPLRPGFAASGGVAQVLSAVRDTEGIIDLNYKTTSPERYRRISERPSPHNLYSSTDALWDGLIGEAPPPPIFTFGDAPADGEDASDVSFTFARNADRSSWTWDAAEEAWLRSQDGEPHTVIDGQRVSAENVIIQLVPITESGIVDSVGLRSPHIDVYGEGEAIVLRGGKAYRGRWMKSEKSEATRFVDGSGEPIPLTPGRTWIELLPNSQTPTLR